MNILQWNVSPELRREAEENYRTTYALALKDRHPLEIIRQLTFDGGAPHISISHIEGLFRFLQSRFIRGSFRGVGVEVGAGPSVFSAVFARLPEVSRMYGVELCRPIVTELAPKVVPFIAEHSHNKVVPVVGDFDHMELSDASVDFVFDFFSLHHSMDISITLAELGRILKPGGFLVMLDKARPDSHTDADIKEMLDTQYGPDFYRQFGVPESMRLTRRQNGEREYRLTDWRTALTAAGFKQIEHWNLQRTAGGSFAWRALKSILAQCPVGLQTAVTGLLPEKPEKHKFGLSRKNRVFVRQLDAFRKEVSLIVAYR